MDGTRERAPSRSPRPSLGEPTEDPPVPIARARARDGSRGHRGRAGRRERGARPVRARGGGPAVPRRRGLRAHARRARARARRGAEAPHRWRTPRGGLRLRGRSRSRQAADHGIDRGPARDRAWVTSDNPRSERPEAIVAEIVAGIPAADRDRHVAEPDRRAAIRAALTWAAPGDVVVIAGKGHEPYQIIGTEVLPFDDRAEARAVLEERPS